MPSNNLYTQTPSAGQPIGARSLSDRFYQLILKNEGVGPAGKPYQTYRDVDGNYTIGSGIQIKANLPWFKKNMDRAGYNQLIANAKPGSSYRLSPEVNKKFILDKMNTLQTGLKKYTGGRYDQLSDDQKLALLDMGYNVYNFTDKSWPKMFNAIKAGDYAAAGNQMLNNRTAKAYKGVYNRHLNNAVAFNPKLKNMTYEDFKRRNSAVGARLAANVNPATQSPQVNTPATSGFEGYVKKVSAAVDGLGNVQVAVDDRRGIGGDTYTPSPRPQNNGNSPAKPGKNTLGINTDAFSSELRRAVRSAASRQAAAADRRVMTPTSPAKGQFARYVRGFKGGLV